MTYATRSSLQSRSSGWPRRSSAVRVWDFLCGQGWFQEILMTHWFFSKAGVLSPACAGSTLSRVWGGQLPGRAAHYPGICLWTELCPPGRGQGAISVLPPATALCPGRPWVSTQCATLSVTQKAAWPTCCLAPVTAA